MNKIENTKNCKVIAIANQKGGVGKTTTSINLATGLSKKGKTVLLIDLDPQGNSSKGLGCEIGRKDITIRDAMIKIVNKEEIYIDYGIIKTNGVSLMPSNPLFSEMDVRFNAMPLGRERVLKKYVDKVRDSYDYIIIDCAPALNTTTMNALVAADEVIIPTEADEFACMGIGQILSFIQQLVLEGYNPNLKVAGILFVKKKNTKIYNKYYGEVKEALKDTNILIYDVEIPDCVKAKEAVSKGVSVYELEKSKISEAYKLFVNLYDGGSL